MGLENYEKNIRKMFKTEAQFSKMNMVKQEKQYGYHHLLPFQVREVTFGYYGISNRKG